MVKLYIQNKPLFLTDKPDASIEEYMHRQTTISIDELTLLAVKTMIHELQEADFYAGVLIHADIQEALRLFKEQFKVVPAAGGLVKTKNDEILLIFRRGKWDLPKGKQDAEEDLETCAVREVEEETGLKSVKIAKPLTITYHSYYEGENHILKESHWYMMTAQAGDLKPQTEEDIEKCEWVKKENLATYMSNMHANIIDVLHKEFGNKA